MTLRIHTIHLVTDDIELLARVGAKLVGTVDVRVVSLRDAGAPGRGEAAPTVLIDMRVRGMPAAAIERVRELHPCSRVLAIAAAGTDSRALYEAGAAAVLPDDGAAIAACCSTLLGLPRAT